MWKPGLPRSSRAILRAPHSAPIPASRTHSTTSHAGPYSPAPTPGLSPTYFHPSHPLDTSSPLPTPSSPSSSSNNDKPPDERTLKLGRTIRILHERMPTLLQSPLPTEILSPSISLHLFPRTHPHLPVVRGRVAYIAALWTAPIAWRRLPGGGNTTLEVLSERMMNGEVLRVRWCAGKDFQGVFLFEFDEEGRVAKHVIENTEEDDGENLAGVITVTEWLLRKAKGDPQGGAAGGGLAWQFERVKHGR